jgi:hypothetical protein
VVDATITVRTGPNETRTVVSRASATTRGGRFALVVDVPSEPLGAPLLELVVHRAGQPGRRFAFPLQPLVDEALDLLTDRARYQPGERVRVWTRVTRVRSLAPRTSRPVRVQLADASGRLIAQHEARTSASGVVTAELALPASAEVGMYRVLVEVPGDPPGPRAERMVQVWRRTVERLLGEVELAGRDRDGVALVAPGGPLRGRVWARTPSGTPVRGATVEVRVRADAEPVELTTGPDGAAAFDLRAPSYLSGDVGRATLQARIVHPAHGTLVVTADYLMARVRALVEATPRGGALVPEVASSLYLGVTDPRGRPLREGTVVAVRGDGVPPGTEVRLDGRGYVEVPITLPRAAASTLRTGPCNGQVATTVEVEVRTDPPVVSRVCARVSALAEVAPRVVGAPIVAPGQSIEVEVARRPSVAARPVLVEALWNGRAVASAWVGGGERQARIELPGELLGTVVVRARAARPPDARMPAPEPGATAYGVGGFDVLLVRPADAFSLSVAPEQPRYLVRQRANVELSTSAPPRGASWVALLARDEAAHGGEGPWELSFLRDELHEAAWQPGIEANARLVRASLASGLGVDPEPPAPPPLEPPYWEPERYRPPYHPGADVGRGVLRDPVALREELLRRGLAPVEQVLERVVSELGPDAASRDRLVEARGARVGFHRDVVQHLVSTRRLAESQARTLGGEPLTVAMVEGADPGFSFDTVAGRIARARLAKLLLALSRLADPDDPAAQRASAQLPPERWLGTLVQLSMVQARDLTDPWGRAYVFRRVTGRPRIAVSERALDWELASPGPDGRLGTADDVRDPFARMVPEGTPYAVTSGEEALLRRFATLAPAQEVLNRMNRAYHRVALAAAEEQRVGPVDASASEGSDEAMADAFPAEEAELELDAATRGAYGGEGRAYPAAPPPPPAGPAGRRQLAETPAPVAQAAAPAQDARSEAFGAMIREDFPATLFFVGEVELGPTGRARIEVPLADALTTYKLEAIAWSASGWTTHAEGSLRVDQQALVDAPVPPFATAGDRLRLPVRVENRGDEPLPVVLEVRAEGVTVSELRPVELEVPPRDAREAVVELTLPTLGEGALVVTAAAQGGAGLDAVRRPIRVLADARTVRERRLELVDGAQEITLEIPAEASERGPGQVTVASGVRLFGDPAEVVGEPVWAGWALAMAGERLPDALAASVLPWVTYAEHEQDYLREPLSSALALAALWDDARLADADAAQALRAVGQYLPEPELARTRPDEVGDAQSDWLLIALAPALQRLERRPALREDVERLAARLRPLAASAGARATDAPSTWTRVAAALALSGADTARAEEMVRRTDRHVVRVGPIAWVEPESADAYGPDGRAQPTALHALALTALGRRAEALSFVRSLSEMRRARPAESRDRILLPPPPTFQGVDIALASAAAARLSRGSAEGVRVIVDDRPLETTMQGGVTTAAVPGLGRPGAHSVRVELASGAVALVALDLSYGMPWTVPPPRTAPIALSIAGELGARDTRSGALLAIQNRGPRLLTRPVVEIELPAGAELDEPTREALRALLRAPARQEGRTLILPLRPLAPGGWARIPLPARWAVGGVLRGLGAVAYDDVEPSRGPIVPVAVLPSRGVELADDGPEPEPPDPESSPPEQLPRPIPILERLAPGGA